jgi:hypothetical protein
MYSESTQAKAGRLINDAIDYSDEFIDGQVQDGTSERARAELGVILAGVALARALKHCSFQRFLRLSLGAFLVSFKLKRYV